MIQRPPPADLARFICEATVEELPALIGALEAAKATAWARLTAPPLKVAERETTQDRNLNAAEAARRLGMSRDWLYRNAPRLPFAVRIGRRVLFDSAGLERWNRNRSTR